MREINDFGRHCDKCPRADSRVVSPSIFSTFAQRDSKSPDCAVDDDDKETSGLEKRQVATCRISHLLSTSDVSRSKPVRLSQGCLD